MLEKTGLLEKTMLLEKTVLSSCFSAVACDDLGILPRISRRGLSRPPEGALAICALSKYNVCAVRLSSHLASLLPDPAARVLALGWSRSEVDDLRRRLDRAVEALKSKASTWLPPETCW